jgi:Zn-dependent peptidase ImmA (M78 family)
MMGSEGFGLSENAPGAVRGFQSIDRENPIIIVEDEGPAATSFVLARAIGDFVAFGSRNACVADLYTDRQAVGRAFAAELMAPGEGVGQMADEGQPFYRIANHYGVSPEVVWRQYDNLGHH